jgi:AraC-like DNA-binding protein
MGDSRRKLTPEFEHDLIRDPRLGYEPPDSAEFVRCVEHGSPTPLERWHCHDEYELQLIVGAQGRAFVGDYVGHFEPGHLVLTGPCLLKRCEDYRLLSSEQTIGSGPADAHSAINRIFEYVNEHYAEPIAVADIAARANMSESSFSRYFSKATDSTFTAFVNRVRVHKACELLMHSDQQISSICYAVGFNNVANFNRRFREVKGVTPREFRRQSMDRLGGGITSVRQGQ